ncbi:hypothetical protein HOC13_00660 [Candidatus Woesearchaeota archaeon]|nr:hypothetical protein [Candidatus Woesearchaeota archaeon]
MKKFLIVPAILIILLFIVGCLDYKAYEVPQDPEDINLLDEIASLEEELINEEVNLEEPTEDVSEEIIVSETEESADLSDLQVIEVKENQLVDLKVKINDPDKDVVEYYFSLPLNEQGKWKTNYGDAGEYVITITATDGKLTTKKSILLVVNRVNVPPIIKIINDMVIKEGELIELEPQVIDPNGDQVSVKISSPLETGSWTTDHTSAGEYEISVTANDGELDNKESFLLTIQDVNVLPEVFGLVDLNIQEGDTVSLEPEVTDLDEDEITLTISEPVGNDGVWETDYTNHGEYVVTVRAFDGKDTVTKTIKLVVEDINMPPEIIEVTLG